MKQTASSVLSFVAMGVASLLVVAMVADRSPLGCEEGNACIGSNAFWASILVVPVAAFMALAALLMGLIEMRKPDRSASRDVWLSLVALVLITVLGWLSWNDPFA